MDAEPLIEEAESLKSAPIEQCQNLENMVQFLYQIGQLKFKEARRIVSILREECYDDNDARREPISGNDFVRIA